MDKPQKPYDDFPLYAHSSGRWAKKIRGKLHYFGKWDDWQKALDKYLEQRDDLYAGRTPRKKTTIGPTLSEIANVYADYVERRVSRGEMKRSTWISYEKSIHKLVDFFGRESVLEGLRPEDFRRFRDHIAEGMEPSTLESDIVRIRVMFKYALDMKLVKEIDTGREFRPPTRKVLRDNKTSRMFEARHIRKMIRLANPTTRAMIFLGINCGFGNIDCHTLMAEEISGGWHSKPRPKTGAARRCNLWASTLHAISQVSSKKSGVVFLAPRGTRLNSGHCDTTVHNFKRFLIRIGLYRKSVTFYTLRRTFRTIADEVLDGPAVDLIMGHIDPSMGAVYRQRIAATRIEAVTDHVAEWLLRYPNASKIVWPISADEVARRNEARALRVHRKRS